MVQGPVFRACYPATDPFTNIVYAVHHMQEVQGSEQKCIGLGQGPKGGYRYREGWYGYQSG